MTLAKILGNNLRMIRLSRNLSRKDAAKLVGLSGSYWGYLERGERNPGLDVIEKIAQVFNISPHVLFLGDDSEMNLEMGNKIERLISLGDEHKKFLYKVMEAYFETLNSSKDQ